MATIRLARTDDAPAIAGVHVRAWRSAYRGIVPDEVLDGLSIERRASFWREVLEHDTSWRQRTWVAEGDAEVVGFATAGASRDDDADRERTGELQAIYLEPAVWRTGIGRALHDLLVDWLRAERFVDATLWVLSENDRARRYYEAMGWQPDGMAKIEEWDGATLDEVRYRISLV